MKNIAYYVILLLMTIAASKGAAQNNNADSLRAVLEKHTQQDSARVKTLHHLFKATFYQDMENAKLSADEALAISEKNDYVRGQAESYRFLGIYFKTKATNRAIQEA